MDDWISPPPVVCEVAAFSAEARLPWCGETAEDVGEGRTGGGSVAGMGAAIGGGMAGASVAGGASFGLKKGNRNDMAANLQQKDP